MVIEYGDISDNFLKYGNLRYGNFSDIRKYGNMPYGNVFRNYYHISTSKYGKIKNL